MDHDIDLTADLNAHDDDGLVWPTLADARDSSRVRPGPGFSPATATAERSSASPRADHDGQVHFSVLPGSVAKNRHLLGRTVR